MASNVEVALPPEGLLIRRFVSQFLRCIIATSDIEYEFYHDRVILKLEPYTFIKLLARLHEVYTRKKLHDKKTYLYSLFDGYVINPLRRALNLKGRYVQELIDEIIELCLRDKHLAQTFIQSLKSLNVVLQNNELTLVWGDLNKSLDPKIVPFILKTVDFMEGLRLGLSKQLEVDRKGRVHQNIKLTMRVDPFVYTFLTLAITCSYLSATEKGQKFAFLLLDGDIRPYRYLFEIIDGIRARFKGRFWIGDLPEVVQLYSLLLTVSNYISSETLSLSIVLLEKRGLRMDVVYELTFSLDQYRVLIELLQHNTSYSALLRTTIDNVINGYFSEREENRRIAREGLELLTMVDLAVKGLLSPEEFKYRALREFIYSSTYIMFDQNLKDFICDLAEKLRSYVIV